MCSSLKSRAASSHSFVTEAAFSSSLEVDGESSVATDRLFGDKSQGRRVTMVTTSVDQFLPDSDGNRIFIGRSVQFLAHLLQHVFQARVARSNVLRNYLLDFSIGNFLKHETFFFCESAHRSFKTPSSSCIVNE